DMPWAWTSAKTFWCAILTQEFGDYAAAIAGFTNALAKADLPEELRYYAFLHRGWCKTCPEISKLREAEDDLLAAATLRPNYGTARLLWAALRCLDPNEDLARPVQAVTEVLTAVKMEPWVVVLTARVLLAIAEDSTAPTGPLRFAGELSPLVSQPVTQERRRALAETALGLLEKVTSAHPSQEAAIHRVAALAILGRPADALAQCDALQQGALAELMRARVQLAAGRTQLAHNAIARALAADPSFVAAWRCKADLCFHVGDHAGESEALAQAAKLLTDKRPGSVLPDAQIVLAKIQERRVRLLLDLGKGAEAKDVQHLVTMLAVTFGKRVKTECKALGNLADGTAQDSTVAPELFGNTPLSPQP